MRKEIYLMQAMAGESYTSFSNRISALAKTMLDHIPLDGLKYTLTESPPPKLSVIPFSRKKIAAITVFKQDTAPVEFLMNHEDCRGAYAVEEALPLAYTKAWADGLRTPGVCLLTLFSRKKTIDHATFIDRWHNSHTPMSIKFHPMWNYNRNVVMESLKAESAPFEGIVEEQFRTPEDLLNPFRFFGPPLKILQRMAMVYTDTRRFIDYGTMETYLATEYVIKSR